MPSSGIILPVLQKRSHDQSKSVNSSWKLKRRAGGFEHAHAFGQNFLADSVSRNECDLMLGHAFLLRRRTTYTGRVFWSKPKGQP